MHACMSPAFDAKERRRRARNLMMGKPLALPNDPPTRWGRWAVLAAAAVAVAWRML